MKRTHTRTHIPKMHLRYRKKKWKKFQGPLKKTALSFIALYYMMKKITSFMANNNYCTDHQKIRIYSKNLLHLDGKTVKRCWKMYVLFVNAKVWIDLSISARLSKRGKHSSALKNEDIGFKFGQNIGRKIALYFATTDTTISHIHILCEWYYNTHKRMETVTRIYLLLEYRNVIFFGVFFLH